MDLDGMDGTADNAAEGRGTVAHTVASASADDDGHERGPKRPPRNEVVVVTSDGAAAVAAPLPSSVSVALPSPSPFYVSRPPIPSRQRRVIFSAHIRSLLSEVFRCLHPAYDGGVGAAMASAAATATVASSICGGNPYAAFLNNSGGNTDGASIAGLSTSNIVSAAASSALLPHCLSTCQYEDNGCFRSYYVFQKRNKHCLKLGRPHRQTYGQLFLTYESIKYRCYSNDCFAACHVVPWTVAGGGAELQQQLGFNSGMTSSNSSNSSGGYPRFRRLEQLRELLFPQLSEEELGSRYPWVCGPMPPEEL